MNACGLATVANGWRRTNSEHGGNRTATGREHLPILTFGAVYRRGLDGVYARRTQSGSCEGRANSNYVVSAWDGGALVGLARALSDDVAIFYLQDILVHPDYRRQGIGQQLLQACLSRYAHVRAKVLLTDNEERQRDFYEKVGFRNTQDLKAAKLNTFVQIEGVD